MTDPLRARLLAVYTDEHRDHLEGLRTALSQGAGADFEEAYRHAHSLKGAARAIELPPVVDLAHHLESLLEAWWEGRAVPDEATVNLAREVVDAIEDLSAAALTGGPVVPVHPVLDRLKQGLSAIALAGAPASAEAASAPQPSPCVPLAASATLRIEAEAADRLARSTAQLLSELERQRNTTDLLRDVVRGLEQVRVQAAGHPWAVAVTSVRDALAEAVQSLEDRDWSIAGAAQVLAEDMARLRMVAAESVLGGFGPMLRQMAAELGKDIRYDAEGLNTLADREVLAIVAEAVVHLLRNAVAHGIEPPERRRAAGKDHAGTLSLRVAVSGARLEIRVRDDGGGIAVDRLAAEAVARGMMTPAQAAYAGDDRLRLLVFQPGLSTADTLSTAAGRGIGMSIVRRVVDRLQGNITLHSAQGQGTEVVLSVPVSVMAQQIVLLRVRGQVFGVPAPALARIVQVAADAVRQVDGGSAALVDGDEVPLADLGAVLGLPGDAPDCCRGLLWVVAIRTPTGVLGLVVDDVLEVRDLPVAPLDAPLADDDRLVGTVMLEREKLALVLSPAGLRMEGGAASRGAVALNCRALPPRILVVDDSPTIRALERSILEAHAYRVDSAEDGREALDRMENDPPDVVVSDLDMPRLDGFGLLVAMRGHPRLSTVPVVLVSSRDSDDDRRRGLALGAAAYLIKTRFSQGEFLNVIGRLSS